MPTYLFGDKIGSTATLVNAAGVVTGSYTYDVFGAVKTQTGAATEFSFTGEQNDPNGLEFLRARYYDPSTGRFLSRDPIGTGYGYAGNNPVNATDPSGLFAANAWEGFEESSQGGALAWSGQTPAGYSGAVMENGLLAVGPNGENLTSYVITVNVHLEAHGLGGNSALMTAGGTALGTAASFIFGPVAIPLGAGGGFGLSKYDADLLFQLDVQAIALLAMDGSGMQVSGSYQATAGNYLGAGVLNWSITSQGEYAIAGSTVGGFLPMGPGYGVYANFHSSDFLGLNVFASASVEVQFGTGSTPYLSTNLSIWGGGASKISVQGPTASVIYGTH